MIQFHLDEHVSHDVARGLLLRGVSATTTTDAGLLGATDEQHLDFAAAQRRVIVTCDPDFLAAISHRADHAGIVFVTGTSRSTGELVRFLCLMHDCLVEADVVNHIEYF